MERVDIATLDQFPNSANSDKRNVARALGCEDLGINYYVLEPGTAFSGGMHTHYDQEEIFYVMEGTATFETPEGATEVGPNGAIRFAPGDFQTGLNRGEERVVALALGAPQPGSDTAIWGPCSGCGKTELPIVGYPEEGGLIGECPDCGAETRVSPPSV